MIRILREPALRPVLLLYILAGLTESACSAIFFLVDHALGLPGWSGSLLLLQSAAMLVALPLWSKVGDRMGRTRLLPLAYGWQIALAPFALLLPACAVAPAVIRTPVPTCAWPPASRGPAHSSK